MQYLKLRMVSSEGLLKEGYSVHRTLQHLSMEAEAMRVSSKLITALDISPL